MNTPTKLRVAGGACLVLGLIGAWIARDTSVPFGIPLITLATVGLARSWMLLQRWTYQDHHSVKREERLRRVLRKLKPSPSFWDFTEVYLVGSAFPTGVSSELSDEDNQGLLLDAARRNLMSLRSSDPEVVYRAIGDNYRLIRLLRR